MPHAQHDDAETWEYDKTVGGRHRTILKRCGERHLKISLLSLWNNVSFGFWMCTGSTTINALISTFKVLVLAISGGLFHHHWP